MELREPLMQDVRNVVRFQNEQLAKFIQGKEFPKNKPVEEAISEVIMEDPEAMADFLTQQRIQEPIITIMLCTGCTVEEAMKAEARKYKKCVEFLGCTGSDFLGELGIDIRITQ